MTLNAALLRSSFQTIVERQPAITPRFYEILFSRYPQVRPMFSRNSARAQQEMLQQALVAVIENLENASWLSSTLGNLGRTHVAYGVTPEMFDWVGDALLSTLSEILRDDWNSEIAQAWQDAYAAIRDLMLAGIVTVPAATPRELVVNT
ncbi:MAG TPA: globin domain-containing protein [Labilithrix sp.]|nr:globin domain-containing protein [Labilithrix sp.]